MSARWRRWPLVLAVNTLPAGRRRVSEQRDGSSKASGRPFTGRRCVGNNKPAGPLGLPPLSHFVTKPSPRFPPSRRVGVSTIYAIFHFARQVTYVSLSVCSTRNSHRRFKRYVYSSGTSGHQNMVEFTAIWVPK